MSASSKGVDELLALMARLRDPARGCPWDRAQDFATIAPFTIEEAYEVAEAIAEGNAEHLRDELGDLLFQVVFHSQMAAERGWFDFAAVASGIHDKLVRRHPHVFVDADAGAGAGAAEGADLAAAWDSHKSAERAAGGAPGALANVPLALPALARAAKLSRRAARVGFDWPDEMAVRSKITEELRETEEAVAGGEVAAIAEELGDVLFAVVNWARQLQVDPEQALRAANRKFERRFAAMEALIAQRALDPGELSAGAWDGLWNEVKKAEA